MSERTRYRLYMSFAVLLAGALLWLWLLPGQKAPAKKATIGAPSPLRRHDKDVPRLSLREKAPIGTDSTQTMVDLLPLPSPLPPDIDPTQIAPDAILYERYTLDELREREGLPAIDSDLIQMENFPMERPYQAKDPDLHEAYVIERELHRTKYLAKHKIAERDRFWAQAQTATSEETKALMRSSAKYHARLALGQQQHYNDLLERRADLAREIHEKRQRAANDD